MNIHELAGIPCSHCGACALRIELRLAVLPLTALAAPRAALSETTRPWLVCGGCGSETEGHPDPML